MTRAHARRSPLALLVTVLTAGLLSVGLLAVALVSSAGPAAAEPTTTAEAERRVAELSDKVTVAAEQYNAARVDLAAARSRQAALAPRVAALRKRVEAYRAQVSEFAASAYRGGEISAFTALLQSGSPQTFLDQLATLDLLSRAQRDELRALGTAQRALAAEQAKVDKAVADQQRQEKILASSKAAAERDLKAAERLRSSLAARASRDRARTPSTAGTAGTGSRAGTDTGTRAGTTRTTRPSSPPPAPSYPGSTSGRGGKVVAFAYAQLGKPYVFAADGPGSYDCSGLTMAAYARVGVSLPHSARRQYALYSQLSRSSLQPGDLVYFYSDLHHVGIYVGNGYVIHAPKPGDVVKKSPMTYMPFAGANRPS